MRVSRLLSRPLAFGCALLIGISVVGSSLNAQQTSTSVQPLDPVDITAYRILFRRAVLYKNLADQADAAHSPKPYLRRILANRFALNDFDSSTLERLSLAYQREIDPLHDQALAVMRQFHARFPLAIVGPGVDASPPPELSLLQNQQDLVVLRYRDLLRSSMREEDFQKLHARIQADFGRPLSKE